MVDGAWHARSTRPSFERWSDFLVACGLIALVLPLMTIVAIAIRCDSRGPVLVWEKRVSPRGHQFWALRFRVLVHETPARPYYNEPHATFVGGIIRYLRIDALPQLVNVLRGEMTCFPAHRDYLFFLQ
jgi:putative colanic acid biosynthesis UDP-glucose lipid carrier transferase